MKNLYKEVFKSSIKIGDTVCIKKEDGESIKLLQGQVNSILPDDPKGVRVEIILDTQSEEFVIKEVGFVEYVIRDGNIEYGSLK